MSKHQKRLSVPNSWPVERKTEKFTVKAGAGPHGESGVPLLVVLRDVLGYVDSRKEARYALNQGSVLVNGDALDDEERPIGMFDILEFDERNEHYRVFPDEGGRLALTTIDADDADSKLGKIEGKQQVSGGATQLALHDGRTLEVDDASEYAGSDSIVVDEDDEILAHFSYEEGALVTAVEGRHAGEVGEIDDIQVTPGSSSNNVTVTQTNGDGFETVAEYVVVIDENFVDDETTDDAGETAADAESTADDEATDDDATDDGGDDE
ncbi:30S ribosomal protein S4e [Halococcus saccharolyticus]|uniref:Small ribosomal subunit protein eS4 n=1 Tax=Halococcus saccharolyticus DSM 5350 TaxID=1227455 RepID=M0MHG0_9EURY|nr:30S ribosomal protein S4e [Halococcus saccharolyticus]EMA44129.1 30S ribosomal protein S4e [Halococcus saccharolyticus DSM 5350]